MYWHIFCHSLRKQIFLIKEIFFLHIIQSHLVEFNMYISLYSLPFTGFESVPESVQTNLSKYPETPKYIICPATWSLFPGGHWPLYDGTYSLRWVPKSPEPRLKYLENFHWYTGSEIKPRTSCLEVGCTTTWATGFLRLNSTNFL